MNKDLQQLQTLCRQAFQKRYGTESTFTESMITTTSNLLAQKEVTSLPPIVDIYMEMLENPLRMKEPITAMTYGCLKTLQNAAVFIEAKELYPEDDQKAEQLYNIQNFGYLCNYLWNNLNGRHTINRDMTEFVLATVAYYAVSTNHEQEPTNIDNVIGVVNNQWKTNKNSHLLSILTGLLIVKHLHQDYIRKQASDNSYLSQKCLFDALEKGLLLPQDGTSDIQATEQLLQQLIEQKLVRKDSTGYVLTLEGKKLLFEMRNVVEGNDKAYQLV